MSVPIRLCELAAALDLEVVGDPEFLVTGVASVESAGPGDLTFVRSAHYARLLAESRAGAVILPGNLSPHGRPALHSDNPSLDFARAVALVEPGTEPPRHVSREALVAPDAKVHPDASVAPGAVIGARSKVGPRTVLHSNATLYPDVEVGADCVIHAGVVLREGTRIGDRVVLEPGVVIGGDGFGYVPDAQGALVKMPHVGRVVIEDDVEIGANTTVDRATLGETRIRRAAKIDNLVQIAHNCDIGEGAVVVAQTGLSGSTVVGRGAMVMAQAGSAGHLRIGDGAFVGARAGLHKDVADGGRVWGAPQMEERTWHRAIAGFSRLPEMLRRLRAVERALGLRPGKPAKRDAEGR
ncbi:MAG: UDP-3-O-(3-hydroxymyristoyl)glucosamine N-acyltransferase [Myxococcota bacterium]